MLWVDAQVDKMPRKVNLKKDTETNRVILYVLPGSGYRSILENLIRQAVRDYKRICWVSINNPYEYLVESLKAKKIDPNKFFFIDCISAVARLKMPPAKNYTLVSSPAALTEIDVAISKCYQTFKPEFILFDSLSTLLIYLPNATITRFVQRMINKVKGGGSIGIFLCTPESDLIREVAMFVRAITLR